jgi:hypothetical protein
MIQGISPPDPRRIGDPEHWRARAPEASAMAQQMSDAEATAEMMRVAELYERLAEQVEGTAPVGDTRDRSQGPAETGDPRGG